MFQPGCIPVIEYPGGVLCIDAGFSRDRMVACYLVEAGDEAAVVETGTPVSAERVRQVVANRGWNADAIRYVIVTHVHLDHAGGAGPLMRLFPRATLLVHQRGAAHMIDPSRLEAGVRQVYGDERYDAMFGPLEPVPENRVRVMGDGESVSLGNRTLEFLDTPGHARHHFCVWDSGTRSWFTGDTFGISYREFDTANGHFIFPTTTPIDFDPEALGDSVEKLLQRGPEWMYLTHFGRVGDVARLAKRLMAGVEAIVEIAERHEGAADRFTEIARDYADSLCEAVRAHGVSTPGKELRALLQPDVELNAQGVVVWLDRRSKGQSLN